jgi:hypothetical protein
LLIRGHFIATTPAVKDFLFFFYRCCGPATCLNLPLSPRLSKSFFTFLSQPKPPNRKEHFRENILSGNPCKGFFSFFFTDAQGLQPRWIFPLEGNWIERGGNEHFGQDQTICVGWGIPLGGWHQNHSKSLNSSVFQSADGRNGTVGSAVAIAGDQDG